MRCPFFLFFSYEASKAWLVNLRAVLTTKSTEDSHQRNRSKIVVSNGNTDLEKLLSRSLHLDLSNPPPKGIVQAVHRIDHLVLELVPSLWSTESAVGESLPDPTRPLVIETLPFEGASELSLNLRLLLLEGVEDFLVLLPGILAKIDV